MIRSAFWLSVALLGGLLVDCKSDAEYKADADLATRQAAYNQLVATPPDPIAVSVPVATPVDGKQRNGLGLRISMLRGRLGTIGISDYDPAPLADGTPRLMGKSADELTRVELIGYGDELERLTVMFGLAKDAPPTSLIRNTGAIMVVTQDTGWSDGYKWVIDAIGKVDVTKRHGDANYRMQTIPGTGVSVLSVSPVSVK